MSDRLHIHSVNAESFGGLSKRRLELPDSPLVVVFGRNEAGKSTFSELISWLLVGPAANGVVVRRFASANEVLKGSLAGTLRGDEFSASAEFKVTPSGGGIGKASVREYQLNGPLTTDQWLDRLGRLDHQAMAGIYRLWGQQLHDGGDADRELRRAGLGVLAESADPRELAKKLESLSKPGAKVGPEESTFKLLMAEVRSVGGELREAEANVDQYRAVEAEIERLMIRRSALDESRFGLERRRNLLEKVSNLDLLRADRDSAADSLRLCAPVGPGWVDVVADMSALNASVRSLVDSRSALEEAQAILRQRMIAAGVVSSASVDELLSKYRITPADAAPIATAVSNVDHSRATLSKAISNHDSALADCEVATNKLAGALDDLDTDSETLRRAKLDEESRVQLGLFSKTFDSELESVRQAEEQFEDSRVAAATARVAHQQALEDWHRMGIDATPDGWRSGTSRVGSTSTNSRSTWALLSVIAAAAVSAAVIGQWILLGLALVALAISWFSRPASSPTGHNVGNDAAAERVATAKSALDSAEITETGATAQLAICRERVGLAKVGVAELSERHGVNFPEDPQLLAGTVAGWMSALELLETAESSRSRVDLVAAEFARATEAESKAKEHLDSLLISLGLPRGMDPDAAGSRAGDFLALVESAHGVRECEERFSAAESALERLLQPVATEVDGWSEEKLMEVAESASKRLQLLGEANNKSDTAKGVLEGSLATDPEVRELFHEGVSSEDRGREVDQISSDLKTIKDDINDISAMIGLEEQRREELRSADRVADLRLSKGSLEESQREVATELAVNRLAGVILRSVADVYERENQPDLVKRTGLLAGRVADEWESIKVKATGPDSSELRVQFVDGSDVAASSLSTGARALLYLSLRLAMADDDGEKRRIQIPILCDDPLVHLDDQRALSAMGLLTEAAKRRQVVMFTCHRRTVEAATEAGAEAVQM